MVHGLVSTPADETKDRVSDPFWACADVLTKMAATENSAKPSSFDFMTIPSELGCRVTRDGYIIAHIGIAVL
jgi:hypothetical protein